MIVLNFNEGLKPILNIINIMGIIALQKETKVGSLTGVQQLPQKKLELSINANFLNGNNFLRGERGKNYIFTTLKFLTI